MLKNPNIGNNKKDIKTKDPSNNVGKNFSGHNPLANMPKFEELTFDSTAQKDALREFSDFDSEFFAQMFGLKFSTPTDKKDFQDGCDALKEYTKGNDLDLQDIGLINNLQKFSIGMDSYNKDLAPAIENLITKFLETQRGY